MAWFSEIAAGELPPKIRKARFLAVLMLKWALKGEAKRVARDQYEDHIAGQYSARSESGTHFNRLDFQPTRCGSSAVRLRRNEPIP